MRKQTVRKTKKPPKKRNHTRRKRGGGLFDFLFKRGPSAEETEEFRKTFTDYITKIIALQDAQRTKYKQSNHDSLITTLRNFKTYLTTIKDDVDRKIEFTGEPPNYIIARNVDEQTYRKQLLDILEEKEFKSDAEILKNIITEAVTKRKNENNKALEIKADRERQIEESAKQKKAEEEDARIEADKRSAQHQNKLAEQKEAEKAEQLQKELAKKAKKEAAEQLENEHEAEQANQKAAIDAIKIRRQKEEDEKNKKLLDNSKTNLAKLKKEKTSSNNIEPKPEVKVVSSKSITPKHAKSKMNASQNTNNQSEPSTTNNQSEPSTTNNQPEPSTTNNQPEPSTTNNQPEPSNTNPSITPYRPKIKPIYHPMYTIDEVPEYWKTYFPNGKLKMFRDFMIYMLNNVKILTDNTQKIFPGFILEKTQNAYIKTVNDSNFITTAEKENYINNYDILIRLVLVFIGIITNAMSEHGCHIMLKGGKAIQMNCPTKYPSNDIDILVVSDTLDKKEIVLEMGKLLVWILLQQFTTTQSVMQHLSMYYVSMIEIPQTEPIVKISAFTHFNTYEAVVDIGFTTPKEEIKSYIVSNPTKKGPFYLPVDLPFNYKLLYITQSVDAMIKEKLYYYMKYAILKNYKPEDNAEFFIQKIYRSLKALLSCKNKDPIEQKKILLTMINTVIGEKQENLTEIEQVLPQTIVDGLT